MPQVGMPLIAIRSNSYQGATEERTRMETFNLYKFYSYEMKWYLTRVALGDIVSLQCQHQQTYTGILT